MSLVKAITNANNRCAKCKKEQQGSSHDKLVTDKSKTTVYFFFSSSCEFTLARCFLFFSCREAMSVQKYHAKESTSNELLSVLNRLTWTGTSGHFVYIMITSLVGR